MVFLVNLHFHYLRQRDGIFAKYIDNIGKMAYLMKFLRNEGKLVVAPMKIIGH